MDLSALDYGNAIEVLCVHPEAPPRDLDDYCICILFLFMNSMVPIVHVGITDLVENLTRYVKIFFLNDWF